ncbi:MAG: C-terminal helicase domain-containing protein, partial [Ginsengibacter sp.]
VSITDEQRAVHDDYAEMVMKIVMRWKKMGFLKEEDRQRLMIGLNMMRMVCNSTYIIDQETNHQTKLDELFNILEEVIAAGEEKIVIFSQWERFTRLIAHQLDEQKIGYANLNGNVPSHKRKDLFDRFNKDDNCRIFLSTDAGGVGLNLQAGSMLFNMDLPWNPAVLEQRISRIYRQGQKRNVNIINFVARNTIEHGMLGKLKFKRALAEGILDNGESNIFVGDSKFNVFMKDIESLFSDETITTSDVDRGREDATSVEKPVDAKEKEAPTTYEDDDVKQNKSAKESKQPESFNAEPAQQLLQTAGSFFAQLGSVLSDAKATENLLQSITKKDEATGQTYLHVPVENENVVKNVFTVLAGLFKGMAGK